MPDKKLLAMLAVAAIAGPLAAGADPITVGYEFSVPPQGIPIGPGEISGTPSPVESVTGSFRFTFDPAAGDQQVTPDSVDLTILGFQYSAAATSVQITDRDDVSEGTKGITFGGLPDASSAIPDTNDFSVNFLVAPDDYFPWFGLGFLDFSVDGIDDYWSSPALINRTEGPVTPPPSVPEPGSLALLALGLAGVGLARRRKAT